ncbi:hypothetical protein [Nitratidesulfovibrio termitidis]|uniref:hypothetical protein n=1 Tax=Nitratidesulfovibrio termitidis TaxID=42252 RepID=UPI000404555F|nr:hypothetical protein [Nitratidesulfovibrio termitidis]
MLASNRSASLWGGFLLATLGAAFCAWAAIAPSESLCVSTGCSLYRNLTIWGLPLWWYGTGAFSLLALFCIFGKQGAARGFVWLMLAADTALLALMALTAPCAACLVVAALIAGAFVAIPGEPRRDRQLRISILLLVWGGLFFANGTALATERMGAWNLQGPDSAPVTLYFSPSCPACRQAIAALAGAAPDTVAYRPVAENDDDILSIEQMRRAVEQGASVADALRTAVDAPTASPGPAMSLFEQVRLRWKLLRNKARVLSSGADRLPVMLMAGMPRLPFGHGADGAAPGAGTPPSQLPRSAAQQQGPFSPAPGTVQSPAQGQTGKPAPAPTGQDASLPFLTNDFAGCAQTPNSNATCD